jgi:hypothetical protein
MSDVPRKFLNRIACTLIAVHGVMPIAPCVAHAASRPEAPDGYEVAAEYLGVPPDRWKRSPTWPSTYWVRSRRPSRPKPFSWNGWPDALSTMNTRHLLRDRISASPLAKPISVSTNISKRSARFGRCAASILSNKFSCRWTERICAPRCSRRMARSAVQFGEGKYPAHRRARAILNRQPQHQVDAQEPDTMWLDGEAWSRP